MFSHDTAQSLLVVVDLVNTSPECNGSELLGAADDVAAWVRRNHVSGVSDDDYQRLDELHAIRKTFHGLFGLTDPAELAARLNALVSRAPVQPRLSDHDGRPWHMHYFAPGASLAQHLAVDGGMAIAQVVAEGEVERLRVCAAPDCEAVLVDLSRNRSRRYCDARSCGNRMNVAAYRERKRSQTRSAAGAEAAS
jgi:predicted RNA-binding Zn ribbon-like protein